MSEQKVICGIDVGTTKIVAIIAEYSDDGNFSIIGIGESKSEGLERGVIVNIKDTIKSLELAIKEAEEQSQYEVDSVFVGISGDHIVGMNGMGVVSVGDATNSSIGSVIDEDDKDRVLKSAQAINLPSERRVLHVLSKHFKVDNRSGIEEPEGLTGSRLEAEVHLVTSSRTTENDFKTCFEELGIDIKAFVLEPLASSYSILSRDEKKLGSVMIDIGGGTTDVVTWEDGGITNTEIIPFGGEIITQDIARTIGCSIDIADGLKRKYGSATKNIAIDEEIIIDSVEGQKQQISSEILSSIIQARIKEILTTVKFKIEAKTNISNLSFGVILTGGGSQLNNILEFAEDIFRCRVREGKPSEKLKSIEKHIFNPKYSTAIGIIQYAIDHKEELHTSKYGGSKGVVGGFFKSLKELFNN